MFILLFFNSELLSERQTMDASVLERIPERYVSTTDSAALLQIGTAMTYDVNKSIQVSAYLLPEEVVDNLPMVSIAMLAKVLLVSLNAVGGGIWCLVDFSNKSYNC